MSDAVRLSGGYRPADFEPDGSPDPEQGNGAAEKADHVVAFPAVGILSKISEWRMKIFLWVGLPALAVAGVMFGAFDVVPAWKAHNGGGTVGTFTAEREECSRRSCSFVGSWKATDGSASRADVTLNDEPDSMIVGRAVEAVDTGARVGVFAKAGGSTYLLITAFAVGGIAAFVGWIFVIRNAFRNRRSSTAAAAA